VDRVGEGGRRGGEGEVYERDNEEGESEDEGRGEVAMGVWELGLIGRDVLGSRLVLEEGGDVGDENGLGAMMTGACERSTVEDVDAAASFGPGDASAQETDMHTDTASQRPFRPTIRLTTPDSNTPSTILPSQGVEHEATPEDRYFNTLDQQRRQRVRFDETLRMHSFGGSQYGGRVVDRDV